MNYKNELERKCFEIAVDIFGTNATIQHNKTIKIEAALFPEVAAFKGPPAKEIDVLVLQILDQPKVELLVSCKSLSRPAEPAHIQEWCAVVQTMNKYSGGTLYFGLIVSPTGFTSGCEPWATSHNLGMIPPLKGRRLVFNEDTVFRMFERTLIALRARLRLQLTDLTSAPAFFDFVYRVVADFEGHQEAEVDGRYMLLPHRWTSSFEEMYRAIADRTIQDIWVDQGGTCARLSGDVILKFGPAHVQFGHAPEILPPTSNLTAECHKNIEMEPCALDFVRSIVVGKQIMSAGDFENYLEIGLAQSYNLGFHKTGFHLISTENPPEDHRL